MREQLCRRLMRLALAGCAGVSAYGFGQAPAAAAGSHATCALNFTRGQYCRQINRLIDDTAARADANTLQSDMDRLVNPLLNAGAFVEAASPSIETLLENTATDPNSAFRKAVDSWEESRLDVQSGSTPTSSGSTNLVAKSGGAALLSAAFEVGAFTQTTAGNTATFHANAGGFLRAIAHDPVVAEGRLKMVGGKYRDPWFTWNNLDASVSVDVTANGGSTAQVVGSATSSAAVPATVILPTQGGRVGAVTVRYSLLAPFDPRAAKFQNAWLTEFQKGKATITPAAMNLAAAINALDQGTLVDAMGATRDTYAALFAVDAKAGDGVKLEKDFNAYFQIVLSVAERGDNFTDRLAASQVERTAFAQTMQDLLVAARRDAGSSLTLEGNYNHPAQQPETYTGRLIWSHPDGNALFTVNGAFTVYGPMPSGAKYQRLRDGQMSAQFDTPLGNPAKSFAALSGAVYLQYQTAPSVLNINSSNLAPGTTIALPANAQVLLGPSGLLVVGQAKVTITAKGGIKIPLAIEASNKTDLLNATDVRGNIGVSYDFSSFSGLFGEGSSEGGVGRGRVTTGLFGRDMVKSKYGDSEPKGLRMTTSITVTQIDDI